MPPSFPCCKETTEKEINVLLTLPSESCFALEDTCMETKDGKKTCKKSANIKK